MGHAHRARRQHTHGAVSPVGLGAGYFCIAGYDYSGFDYARAIQSITYQPFLYAVLRCLAAPVVVETGMQVGISTVYALHAMRRVGGVLYSLDGSFSGGWDMHNQLNWWNLVRPDDKQRWRPMPVMSQTGLELLPAHDQQVDVFVHDSDHEYLAQHFEYSWAWDHLKPGGYLISDDFVWNGGQAWAELTARTRLAWYTIGTAAIMRKE